LLKIARISDAGLLGPENENVGQHCSSTEGQVRFIQ
jgi:hypothetical protein